MKKYRLDKHLSQQFPQYSRAFLKSQIKLGNILVNSAIKKPSYILKKEDKVQINLVKKEKTAIQPNPNIELNIIYEDKNIIVIDKPTGISAHPSKPNQNDTIANALLAYYPEIASVGDEPELRPGIVHRLDKETSGLMVVAKNNVAFDWLKKQFAQRKVVKKYLALVIGNIKENKGIITKPIGKAKDFRKRTTIPLKKQKEAVTYYRVLKYYFPQTLLPSDLRFAGGFGKASEGRTGRGGDLKQPPLSISPLIEPLAQRANQASTEGERMHYTLLEAEPKTGRTHQIRVHLASIGHPIANDTLYGFKRQTPLLGLERQFLHAAYLKFSLPDGRIIELNSELPKDLQLVLSDLK